MSRSYRKPYATILHGTKSEHLEKKLASRAWRRLIKQTVAISDPETVEIPKRLEAAYNNRYSWLADGGNRLCRFPTRWDFVFLAEFGEESFEENRQFWLKLHRK